MVVAGHYVDDILSNAWRARESAIDVVVAKVLTTSLERTHLRS